MAKKRDKVMTTTVAAKRKVKENGIITKNKKQKVALEIPKISSVVGKLFVMGDNSTGQIGFDSDVIEKKRPQLLEMDYDIVDIAAGAMHSVCLTQDGKVITFGCNDEGALGRKVDESDESLEYSPGEVTIPERIVQISAGDSHTAALSESGQVYIWGNFRNNSGVMGLIDRDVRQNFPITILNDVRVVKIASGSDHLSCLSDEGILYTCGNAEAGQLGRVTEHSSVDGGRKGMIALLQPQKVSLKSGLLIVDVWAGSSCTFIKLSSGVIYAFGLNNWGQLGTDPKKIILWRPTLINSFKDRSWKQMTGGQHHTLALDDKGLVYSLGRSEYGRLGLGEDVQPVSQPTVIPTLEDKKCIDISSGNCESFAVEDIGTAYSWGFGTNFQLGHGTDEDQMVPRRIEALFQKWKCIKVSGGGQHTLILAHQKTENAD